MELYTLFLTCVLALAVEAASTTSFTKSCQALDGQLFGPDKVGFYCFTKNVEQYDYKFSLSAALLVPTSCVGLTRL